MSVVVDIDNVITGLFTELQGTYHKEYTKLYTISQKYPKPTIKLKELMSQSTVFSDAKELFLNSSNKQTLKLMENYLGAIAQQTGVKVANIAFYADFKTINNIYIDGIDRQTIDAINQNMGINLFNSSEQAYTNVSKALNISLSKASTLMREALNTTVRSITKKAYDKIEKDLSKYIIKYKYTGPSDSKTSRECNSIVGMIKTADEWTAIKSDIFIRGMHPNCRHSLDIQPVKKGDLK